MVTYQLIPELEHLRGQWEDPVGEAKGIVQDVIVGWGTFMQGDAIVALQRAVELLQGLERHEADPRRPSRR
jgi:hypothetical protein